MNDIELNLTCSHCNEQCEVWEEVSTGYGGPWEIWCYCKKCKLESFHPSPFWKNPAESGNENV